MDGKIYTPRSITEGFGKAVIGFISLMFGGLLLMYMVGSWDVARREANYHEEMSEIYRADSLRHWTNLTTLKKQAITNGFAQYNPTNAQWEWKVTR